MAASDDPNERRMEVMCTLILTAFHKQTY